MSKKTKDAIIYIFQLIVMVIVTYIVFTQIVRPIRIIGPSMTPTLHDDDFAITNVIGLKLGDIERFDIVVIDGDELNDYIIKRVIGLPGETIEYRDDHLYIDGKLYEEHFLDSEFMEQSKKYYGASLFTNDFIVVVPDDEYFVLGDNRLNSQDSRYFGAFRNDEIIGKGGLAIFPLNHFNWIK